MHKRGKAETKAYLIKGNKRNPKSSRPEVRRKGNEKKLITRSDRYETNLKPTVKLNRIRLRPKNLKRISHKEKEHEREEDLTGDGAMEATAPVTGEQTEKEGFGVMATEETEYESDPEELKRALATRRREASDDEDEGLKEPQVDSDDATLEYDDDDSYYDDEEDLEYIADNDKASVAVISEPDASKEEDVVDGEEQKPKEPFAVPTAGAFYMHDDRFQEMDKASNRRMRGGRRLWQSRDQSKWGHDKYEEMNTPQKQYHTTSRGRARGRGYSRGTNSKAFTTNGHQNQFPKALTRGRGPRRYEAALRNGNQAPSVQNKQSRNSYVKVSQVDSGRESAEKASTETDAIQAKKNVVASSLNSASPPFYPSGSSINVAQKDLQPGMGRLHVNEKPTPSGKKFGNPKSSLSWVRTAQPSQTTSQGIGAPPPGQALYQQSRNQGDKVSSSMQLRGVSKGTDQNCTQPPDLATESDALLAKGKGTLQPSGKGSFMHGGAQFMGPAGSIAAGQGNPNFPAFLPFMQFGGQHGGVPTFGMALPGYVQPEHGTGNPEMTWLPILTGPGALGASYSPYALPSSVGPSIQENSSSNPNDEEKSMERPEVTNNRNSQ